MYGGQAAAIFESITSDGCDRIGDGDGGQAPAISESLGSNGRDGIRNGDGGQSAFKKKYGLQWS